MGFYKFIKRLIQENKEKRIYIEKLKKQIKDIKPIEELEEV